MANRLIATGLLILFSHLLQAQETIKGTYNRAGKIFVADDDTYWIDYFTNGIARIAKDGYMGLVDSTGKIICPVKYDIIYPLEKEVIRMGIAGRLGLLNYKGAVIAEAQFDELWPFAEGMARFREQQGYQKGFISKDGLIIARGDYQNLADFNDGMGRYQKGEQYGIISRQGKETALFTKKDFTSNFEQYNPYPIGEGNEQYDRYTHPASIRLLEFTCGLAPVPRKIKGEQYFGFTDTMGTMVIPVQYDSVSNFRNGFAAVKKDGYWGAINTKGRLVIPHQYDVVRLTDTCFFIVSKKGKWGIADTAHTITVALQHRFIKHLFGDVFGIFKTAAVEKKGNEYNNEKNNWGPTGKWGAINSKGQMIMPLVYDAIETINNNLAKAITIVSRHNLNTGIPRYIESADYVIFNTAGLVDNATYGERATKVGLTYDSRDIFDVYDYSRNKSDAAYLPLQLKHKNGLLSAIVVNAKGEKVIATNYYKIHAFSGDKALVSKLAEPARNDAANKPKLRTSPMANSNNVIGLPHRYPFEPALTVGMINNKGGVIIPAKYVQVGAPVYFAYQNTAWVKDFIPVKQNDKWGVRDEKNNIVAAVQYDQIVVGYCGAVVQKKGRYGFIDFKGNQLIPVEYEELRLGYNGLLVGEIDGKYYEIDKKGNRRKQ